MAASRTITLNEGQSAQYGPVKVTLLPPSGRNRGRRAAVRITEEPRYQVVISGDGEGDKSDHERDVGESAAAVRALVDSPRNRTRIGHESDTEAAAVRALVDKASGGESL